MQINSVNAGQGASWFKCGWELFKQDFGTWFIMFLIFIGIFIVSNFIPFIGWLVMAVISPVLIAGFMYSASMLDQGSTIEISHLFQGFRDKERMNKLLILGALYLLVQVVLGMVMVSLVGGTAMLNVDQHGAVDPPAMMSAGTMITMLLVILVGLVIAMGFLYATPLVMLDNMAPISAIKTSYSGCLKNILPLLVFGIVYFILAIIAAIPLGLGFLVLIPVSMLAMYCSYRSLFH